jgi:transposase
MQVHLDEISRRVAPGAQAILIMDRAGWHTTNALAIPKNITPILLPSYSPELNPVENIWQYLRANWLSNSVFETYDAIIDVACDAWNKLIASPDQIKSIGMREWAHVGRGRQPLVLGLDIAILDRRRCVLPAIPALARPARSPDLPEAIFEFRDQSQAAASAPRPTSP